MKRVLLILVAMMTIVTFCVFAEEQVEVIHKGSKGDAVVEIQERLQELGYLEGKADGSFGNKAKVAVEEFQKNNGLKVTGEVDAATKKVLDSERAYSAPIVRKKGKKFSIGDQELTIKSTSFKKTLNWKYVKFTAQSDETYLVVKATLRYNGSGLLESWDALDINANYNGRTYYGVKSPSNNDQYYPNIWAADNNSYLSSGKNIDMTYWISVPKEASKTGSLSLEFDDGTEMTIR